MPLDPYYALTGKKPQQYSDMVRAQAPYSLQAYLNSLSDAQVQEALQLDKDALAQQAQQWQEQMDLQEQMNDEQEDSTDLSNMIGGLDMGTRLLPHLNDAANSVSDMLSGDGGMGGYTTVDPGPAIEPLYPDPVDDYITNNPIDLNPSLADDAPSKSLYESDVFADSGSPTVPNFDFNLPSTAGLTDIAMPTAPTSFNDAFWGGDAVSRFSQDPATLSNLPDFSSLALGGLSDLAAWGTANTAATGGLVGGADIAGLAAAEAGLNSGLAGAGGAGGTLAGGGAGAGGAGAGGSGLMGTISAAAPYVAAALQLYNILSMHYGKRDPVSYGAKQILEAAEGQDEITGGYKPEIVESDGQKYLKDAAQAQNYGNLYYHNISDNDYLEKMRNVLGEQSDRDVFAAGSGLGMDERSEFYNAQPGFGRDSDQTQSGLYDLGQRMKKNSYSGMKSGDITGRSKSYRDEYDKLMNSGMNGLR